MKERNWLIKEMEICREYCSAILRERQQAGFSSLKYPLVQAKVNRYFLPEFRYIIAETCNLIGYMDIPPVEFWFEKESYDKSGKIEVELDTTKSDWQEELFKERWKKREEAENRKLTPYYD